MFQRRWRREARREDLQFTLYTRQGCHLCEDAWTLLQNWQRRHGFRLEAVDIDTDPALQALHGNDVPVVAVDGKVRFRGRINPLLLQRLFAAKGES
jgi:glutaredoxin